MEKIMKLGEALGSMPPGKANELSQLLEVLILQVDPDTLELALHHARHFTTPSLTTPDYVDVRLLETLERVYVLKMQRAVAAGNDFEILLAARALAGVRTSLHTHPANDYVGNVTDDKRFVRERLAPLSKQAGRVGDKQFWTQILESAERRWPESEYLNVLLRAICLRRKPEVSGYVLEDRQKLMQELRQVRRRLMHQNQDMRSREGLLKSVVRDFIGQY